MFFCEYCSGIVEENKYTPKTCCRCGAPTEDISGFLFDRPVLKKDEENFICNPYYCKLSDPIGYIK